MIKSAKIDKDRRVLVLEIDMEAQLRPSTSGKTLVVASTRGNQKTDLEVDGKPVIIGLNAYIKAS